MAGGARRVRQLGSPPGAPRVEGDPDRRHAPIPGHATPAIQLARPTWAPGATSMRAIVRTTARSDRPRCTR